MKGAILVMLDAKEEWPILDIYLNEIIPKLGSDTESNAIKAAFRENNLAKRKNISGPILDHHDINSCPRSFAQVIKDTFFALTKIKMLHQVKNECQQTFELGHKKDLGHH